MKYGIFIAAVLMLLGGGWLGAQVPTPCVERELRLQRYGTIVATSRHSLEVKIATLVVALEQAKEKNKGLEVELAKAKIAIMEKDWPPMLKGD